MSKEKLSGLDPVLAEIIRETKLFRLKKLPHFERLVRAIISQQLSTKAADTIAKRFIALFPGKKFPEPKDILKMSPQKMRAAGLSRAKATFIKDLAGHVAKGKLKLDIIHKLPDEEVMRELVAVKGIGKWTAEMFLIFSLRRPDVFSAGDMGLQNAIKKIYKLKKHPTPKQLEKISIKWKPYRSLACMYLWASLDNKKQD
jgi:DNA-3-methyladenine glycosylase II